MSNVGILNHLSSSPFINGVNIAVEGTGTAEDTGIFNHTSCSPTMIGVIALVWGGELNVGVYNYSNSSPLIDGANILVLGATGADYGVFNLFSNSVTIRRSTISGDSDALFNTSSLDSRP